MFVKKNKQVLFKNMLFKQYVNDDDVVLSCKKLQYIVEVLVYSSLYGMY